MRSSYYVGVSFYNRQIQLAEIDHGRKKTVTALNERGTAIDFAHDESFSPDHPQLYTFVYELEELLKSNKVHSKMISFALPTESVLINVIPLDQTLQGNELTSHLQWEFGQYYPDAPLKDFLISAYPVKGAKQGTKIALLVAVRRGLIGFFKRAAAELRLDVHLVDIDHFSAEKTLRHSLPEVLKDNILLLGMRGTGLDASLVAMGEYSDYRGYVLEHSDDLKNSIVSYRQYLEQMDGHGAPSRIVVYGTDVSQHTLALIHRETGVTTVPLDSVRNLETSKKLDADIVKDNSRFAAAIGLALRTQ